MYELKPASEEQQRAIDDFANYNIIVDSVAGSGKTTLCLHIAKTYPERKILLLTYNAKLKLETRQKIVDLEITNMEIHSYHSFCVKYIDSECYTDGGIIQMMKKGLQGPRRHFHYDAILLDEAQDMSPLYFQLACMILKWNQQNFHMCIMGDKNQSIYQFNHADSRYIEYGKRLFETEWNPYEWKQHSLSESFRITHSMAEMLNHCFLKESRLISRKENIKPRYIICDSFGDTIQKRSNHQDSSGTRIYQEVKQYLRDGYEYEDIFILAPSVKSMNSPVRILANELSDHGIPIYVPTNDDEKLDEEVLHQKIVFSTFHQVKGLERKVVIVYSMDASYFEYYNKNANPMKCPNEIYVACTRASERLTLIHHYNNDFLPFLDAKKIERYSEYEEHMRKVSRHKVKSKQSDEKKFFVTYVTDVVKHLPVQVISECLTYFDCEEVQKKGMMINIPLKTKQKNLYESVSEITGIAIPNFYELIKTGRMTIVNKCMDQLESIESNKNTSFFSDDQGKELEEKTDEMKLREIDLARLSPEKLLYIANLWNSLKTGYIFKVNQIKKYNWLSEENVMSCMERLEKQISSELQMEMKVECEKYTELRNRKLVGYIDCVEKNRIWEFKCVQQLEDEHKIQLAIYMYMYYRNQEKKKKTIFFTADSDDEESNNKKRLSDEERENIEDELQMTEVLLDTLCDMEPELLDIVDFIHGNKEYIKWTIVEILKDGNYMVMNGKKKKTIPLFDILLNHSVERKQKTLEKRKNELKKKLENDGDEKEDEDHFYLYNILDDQKIEIRSDIHRLTKMIDYLIYHKYFVSNFKTDEEFLRENFEKRDLILSHS